LLAKVVGLPFPAAGTEAMLKSKKTKLMGVQDLFCCFNALLPFFFY